MAAAIVGQRRRFRHALTRTSVIYTATAARLLLHQDLREKEGQRAAGYNVGVVSWQS